MLNLEQLQVAVAAAGRRFDLIKNKYPELKARFPNGDPAAYLVLSSPRGQTGIQNSPAKILDEFPAMVLDSDTKTSALHVLSRLKLLESQPSAGPETARLRKQLDQLVPGFLYDEQCQVEMRFNNLKYDLVQQLQTDDLVDQSLTPRTKASIRIVLGTLAEFAGTMP